MLFKVLLVIFSSVIYFQNEEDKVIAFERAGLVFIFNFHPIKSFLDYKVGLQSLGEFRIVLDSDTADFGGVSRIDHDIIYQTVDKEYEELPCYLELPILPSRTAIALACV